MALPRVLLVLDLEYCQNLSNLPPVRHLPFNSKLYFDFLSLMIVQVASCMFDVHEEYLSLSTNY